MKLRSILRPRGRARTVGRTESDLLRTPEDAAKTGLIMGITGEGPWAAAAVKEIEADRRARGGDDEQQPRRAGRSRGRQAGRPAGD